MLRHLSATPSTHATSLTIHSCYQSEFVISDYIRLALGLRGFATCSPVMHDRPMVHKRAIWRAYRFSYLTRLRRFGATALKSPRFSKFFKHFVALGRCVTACHRSGPSIVLHLRFFLQCGVTCLRRVGRTSTCVGFVCASALFFFLPEVAWRNDAPTARERG